MARISQTRIDQCLRLGADGRTTTEQGRALEDLVCYLFEKIPGISVTERNQLNVFHSEEIDVAFWNDKSQRGLYFLPDILLVECKNWSRPVGSEEVAWFDTKVKHSGLDFGILVAPRGITGTPGALSSAHNLVAAALQEQRRLVAIKGDEIGCIGDTAQVVSLLKRKLCQLAVYKTTLV